MIYLLSDEMRDMGSLHFEGAVIGPEVNRVGDTGASPLVHHLCRLRARDVELEIRIFLPVSEQEGELEQESVVCVAQGGKSLGTGVPVQAALEAFACANQFLPILEAVRVGFLLKQRD